MMIRRYNLLSVPFLSFFSKRAYRDVGRNWKGVNFAYLFLLLAICCIPPTLTLREQMVDSLEQGQVNLISQIPEVQIENGHVIVEQTDPIFIKRKDGTAAVIIDTTGSMNYIDDAAVFALLTESSLIIRRSANTFNTFDLSGVTDFHINQHIVNEWLTQAKRSIAPLSYGIFLMLSYIFSVMVMLLAAVVGLILSLAMHGTLNFASALRVATVAATPSIIFITITATLGMTISPGVHLAMTMIYLVVGINACTKTANEGQINLKAVLHDEPIATQEAA